MMALGRMGIVAAMLALASVDAAAQADCPSLPAAAAADSTPDVLIRARADIRELRFETRPRTSVRTLGCAGVLDFVVVTERVNLPDPVEPGVTYRDVRVGVEIRADFQVACLLPALAADPVLGALCAPPASAAPQPDRTDAPAPATPPRR